MASDVLLEHVRAKMDKEVKDAKCWRTLTPSLLSDPQPVYFNLVLKFCQGGQTTVRHDMLLW